MSDPHVVQFPPDWWQRSHDVRRCGAQSADHLGEKRRNWVVVGKVVCVLGTTVSGMARRSQ